MNLKNINFRWSNIFQGFGVERNETYMQMGDYPTFSMLQNTRGDGDCM